MASELDFALGISDRDGRQHWRVWLAERDDGMVPPWVRWLGVVWVFVSVPFITAFSAFGSSPGWYVFVFVFMASGAYTAPALVAAEHAVRHSPARDRASFRLLQLGLVSVFAIGVGMLVGLVTGWRWGNHLAIPAVIISGAVHIAGLVRLVRSRSGRRALSVDVLECAFAVLAVTAPAIVLWGPAVVSSDASWFAVPAALATFWAIVGTFWGAMLLVRLGPGRGGFEICDLGLAAVGATDAALQTAHGITGFGLPFPPLIALHALCMSMYLLIPLHVPLLVRPGLGQQPPQAQVRGSRMSTLVGTIGLVALLMTTYFLHDERPWAVPFALAVVSVLFLLGALRQMAASEETKRLYGQVEVASEERRRLLAQLLERSVQDRRRFAGQLYEQAMAAYASFNVLAGSDRGAHGAPSPVAEASARVSGDLARNAEFVRELVLAIRPLEDERDRQQRLGIPITAYLTSLYGDQALPRLGVTIADDLALDWISETVLLQIVQEALHNVWSHSQATAVDVAIATDGNAVTLTVSDDGVGFDLAAVPERSGLATMRAAAAVVGGSLVVDSLPEEGTSISARLAPAEQDSTLRPTPKPAGPTLRLLRSPDDA